MESYLEARGRAVTDMKYSLMTRVVYRETQAQLDGYLQANDMDGAALRERGLIIGTAGEVVDQLGALVEAGVERFMLQWMDLDDIENLGIAGAGCAAAFLIALQLEQEVANWAGFLLT